MLKVWLYTVILLISNSALSFERLSFYKLILSPQQYEGKEIYLTGYFIANGSDCLVVSNDKETAMMYREYEMVRLCKNTANGKINAGLFKKLNNNYGSVAGIFSIEHCGSDLKLGRSMQYLGCLSKVVELHGPIYESGPVMPPPPVSN